jgi:hypothetical protein
MTMSGGGSKNPNVGISPQQAALSEYTKEQGLDKAAFTFGQTGTGHSTMATQAAGGAQMAGAMEAAGLADANAAFQVTQAQQLGGSLGNLASSLGNLFG